MKAQVKWSSAAGTTSRRSFVASAMAGFFVGATRVYGQDVKRDEQKLRVFKVGTGHMGAGDIDRLAMTGDVIFIGLCDVSPTAFPKAARDGQKLIPLDGVPRFTDYREMLDRIADQCDAVCVSTPDHTHACIVLAAGAGGGCREPEGRLCEDHGGRDGDREPRRLDGEGRRRGGSPGPVRLSNGILKAAAVKGTVIPVR